MLIWIPRNLSFYNFHATVILVDSSMNRIFLRNLCTSMILIFNHQHNVYLNTHAITLWVYGAAKRLEKLDLVVDACEFVCEFFKLDIINWAHTIHTSSLIPIPCRICWCTCSSWCRHWNMRISTISRVVWSLPIRETVRGVWPRAQQ